MSAVAVTDVSARNESHLAPRVAELDVDLIDIGPNVRSQPGDLDELAASIAANGVLQPIRVRHEGSRYRLLYGQRRLLASKQAGRKTIPAILDDREGDVAGDAIEQLVENLQRQDLGVLDEARALKVVLDADPSLTQTALADRIGRSAPFVSNSLRILELVPAVQKLVEQGKLSGAHAKVLAGVAAAEQEDVAKRAVAQATSSHQLERDVEWMAQRAAQAKSDAAKNAAARKKFLAGVEAKIQRDAPIQVTGYGDAEGIIKALKAAGYKKVSAHVGWIPPRPAEKFCDCVAYKIDTGYGGGSIARMCVKPAHAKAAETASHDAYQVKEAASAASRDVITKAVAAELEHRSLPLTFARVLLWKLLGSYQRDQWAQERATRLFRVLAADADAEAAAPAAPAAKGKKPKRKKADAWQEILSLGDYELRKELLERFTPYDPPALDPERDLPADLGAHARMAPQGADTHAVAGADLKALRKAAGLSLRDLARAGGVGHPTIAGIEALAVVSEHRAQLYREALRLATDTSAEASQ